MRNSSDPPTLRPHTQPFRVFVTSLLSAVVVAGLVTALAAWTFRQEHDAALVDYAAWVEAISTLAAVAIATIAAVYAFRAYMIEDGREQRLVSDIRQQQASRVAAWWFLKKANERSPVGGLRIALRNASDLPVTGVVLILELHGLSHQGPLPEEVPDWETPWRAEQQIGVLPPNTEALQTTITDYAGLQAARNNLQKEPEPELRVSIRFRDTNNIIWHRDADGLLDEMPSA